MKRNLLTLLVLLAAQAMMAQLTSLGFVEKYNSPKLSLLDNQLYAATSQGLYQRNLDHADSIWRKLPSIEGAVTDFEVRGDTLIVLTDSCLMISTDGGFTSKSISVDAIVPGWKEDPYYNGSTSFGKIKMQGLAVHPQNTKKLYVAYKGLSYSEDGGESWHTVDENMRIEGICYNPLDATNLIAYTHTTTDIIVLEKNAKVYVSTDAGANWKQVSGFHGSYTTELKGIAFHPTEADKAMLYGTGIYAISEDSGLTWETIGTEPVNPDMDVTPLVYLDYLVYDSRNPNILYGADWKASYETEKKVRILRSTDGGLSWDTFYTIDNTAAVRSMSIDNGVLAIATGQRGIYLLDVDALEASISSAQADVIITPYYDLMGREVDKPTRGIYIKDGKKVIVE